MAFDNLLLGRGERDDRVAILTVNRPKGLNAPDADINELARQSPTSGRERALAGQQFFDLVGNLGKPLIAAINSRTPAFTGA
jgi:enoyl-CoA hydratase/carnithine racemase